MQESFFERVYEVVRQIPYGRVSSYGSIAKFLGSGRSARMVGWAMNASHHCRQYVPAHRVVSSNGILSGKHHFGGSMLMQQLLENEGIKVVNDQVQNFEQIFWDPAQNAKISR